jgi:nucleoside-diphosphate-sugar epimerase
MKALVIGAAGGFGGGVARALMRRGHEVRALARPGGRRPALDRAEIVEGDALNPEAMDRAGAGVDAIVWGFHLPYTKWVPGAVNAARITADVAARHHATVLFPGNLYGLGSGFDGPISESVTFRPRSRLGEIRNEIESIFAEATTRGARVIVLRAGDYFGPRVDNSWLSLMTSRVGRGGRIFDPATTTAPHAWAYLPDVTSAGALLLEKRSEFTPFETFHFEGYSVDTGRMIDAVRNAVGDPTRGVWRFPWWTLKAASPFSAMLRHILTVRYLWDEPVVLDGSKLRLTLPDFSVTPLGEAVAATLSPPLAPLLPIHNTPRGGAHRTAAGSSG